MNWDEKAEAITWKNGTVICGILDSYEKFVRYIGV